ncbi:MAG: phosphoribosyltransferase [bacterium]
MGFDTMKGFRTKKHLIVDPWKDREDFVSARMPRLEDGERGDIGGLYKVIAGWLVRNGIGSVAGPVCSGAVMAYAISAASGGKLVPVFLGKAKGRRGSYRPAIHSEELNLPVPYVLVDDVIDSGDEMRHSIWECESLVGEKPRAIVALSVFARKGRCEEYFKGIPIFEAGFRK